MPRHYWQMPVSSNVIRTQKRSRGMGILSQCVRGAEGIITSDPCSGECVKMLLKKQQIRQ